MERYTRTHEGEAPVATAIEGLVFMHARGAKLPSHLIMKPSLCVTLRGAKESTFGERTMRYAAGTALVVGIEMPAVSRVVQASDTEPYLGVALELDADAMRDVVGHVRLAEDGGTDLDDFAACVTAFDERLESCLLRLVGLIETPDAIPALSGLIMREICYWLLASPSGPAIARFILGAHRSTRVARALHKLREEYAQPIRVEELADVAQMSVATFYREFKALTAMTPLQYQKQLRLLQARAILIADAASVETAAYRVGYESPSQFSREYARMFGAPPRRDVASL